MEPFLWDVSPIGFDSIFRLVFISHPGSRRRILRTIRAVAKIGQVFLPVAFLANIFGYVNLGNLLGIIFLRTERDEDWARIRSDLAVAVKEALSREKIGIA